MRNLTSQPRPFHTNSCPVGKYLKVMIVVRWQPVAQQTVSIQRNDFDVLVAATTREGVPQSRIERNQRDKLYNYQSKVMKLVHDSGIP